MPGARGRPAATCRVPQLPPTVSHSSHCPLLPWCTANLENSKNRGWLGLHRAVRHQSVRSNSVVHRPLEAAPPSWVLAGGRRGQQHCNCSKAPAHAPAVLPYRPVGLTASAEGR